MIDDPEVQLTHPEGEVEWLESWICVDYALCLSSVAPRTAARCVAAECEHPLPM